MTTSEVRLMLTSVGALVTPGIIHSLRKGKPEHFYIVGVDMQDDAVGFHFVDKGYVVPSGNSSDYLPRVWQIAREERIQVIVPRSDEETLTLSSAKGELEARGIAVACSEHEVVARASDKGAMLEFLRAKGISTPRFYLPDSVDDLRRAAKALGYPNSPVVVKPRRSRGGRGVVILEPAPDVLGEREFQRMPLECLASVLAAYATFPPVVVMEHLPGLDYSVDALADHGKPLIIVPRRRVRAMGGASQVGEITPNEQVTRAVADIIRAFGFHTNVNVQLRESTDGTPLVYEINPRTSGTIAINAAAGADLLYYWVRLALGWDVPAQVTLRYMRMTRYWAEQYVYGDGTFVAGVCPDVQNC